MTWNIAAPIVFIPPVLMNLDEEISQPRYRRFLWTASTDTLDTGESFSVGVPHLRNMEIHVLEWNMWLLIVVGNGCCDRTCRYCISLGLV